MSAETATEPGTGPVRVVITGVSGRMGTTLLRCVRDAEGMRVVGATERPGSTLVGLDAGLATRLGALEVSVEDDLAATLERTKPDVVVDFTSAAAGVEHARICAQKKVALVLGSTGFTPEATAEITQLATGIPIVMTPNMSIGVTVLLQVAAELTRVLGEAFDVEVVELHHRLKKDAPSGTALRLAEEIARASGRTREDFRLSREGLVGARTDREIGLQTLRGGDVVGEHTVYFLGDGERIELTHRATSRDSFALGAVRAARWVTGRAPGLYDMRDVLGLRAQELPSDKNA